MREPLTFKLPVILLLIFITSNCNATFTTDATGNTYLKECLTHKEFMGAIKQEVEKEKKGLKPNYDLLETFVGCFTAATIAFRTITEVGYTWSDVNSICYIDYHGMDQFTGFQISDLLLKYLEAHPEHRQVSLGLNMALLLQEYYPIPKKCFTKKAANIKPNQ